MDVPEKSTREKVEEFGLAILGIAFLAGLAFLMFGMGYGWALKSAHADSAVLIGSLTGIVGTPGFFAIGWLLNGRAMSSTPKVTTTHNDDGSVTIQIGD